MFAHACCPCQCVASRSRIKWLKAQGWWPLTSITHMTITEESLRLNRHATVTEHPRRSQAGNCPCTALFQGCRRSASEVGLRSAELGVWCGSCARATRCGKTPRSSAHPRAALRGWGRSHHLASTRATSVQHNNSGFMTQLMPHHHTIANKGPQCLVLGFGWTGGKWR